jgi:hypothetical protein
MSYCTAKSFTICTTGRLILGRGEDLEGLPSFGGLGFDLRFGSLGPVGPGLYTVFRFL